MTAKGGDNQAVHMGAMKETAGGVLEAVKDNLNRLTNLAATKTSTGTPITNFGYQYDAAGNRTQKSTLDYTEDYGYDPLYRLTRTDRTNPGATPPNQWTWNYDAVGNRTSAQKDSEATTSSYNEKNQLTGATGGGKMLWRGTLNEPGLATFNSTSASINGQPARMLAGNVFEATLDLPAGANNVTIQAQDGSGNIATKSYSINVIGVPITNSYDANGNLVAKTEGADSWTYSWNALNQLTAVAKNGTNQATYSYDPRGRRVEKVAATTTVWLYDGPDIVRQTSTTGPSTATTGFVRVPSVDEPMAQEDVATGASVYLHTDSLGSIAKHTSSLGAVTETILYDPWGNIQSGTPTPFGFTGREWDASASLYYYRARYYDPSAARFASEDPIGLLGGLNLYAYVQDDPVNRTDPSGLSGSTPTAKDKVSVCCRAADIPGNNRAGYKHCYIQVDDYHLELQPAQMAFISTGYPQKTRAPVDPTADCATTEGCGLKDCLAKAFKDYPAGGPYNAMSGPNSNTFVTRMAQTCHLSAPPSLATAPGANAPVPPKPGKGN